jgi:hypothetical protein
MSELSSPSITLAVLEYLDKKKSFKLSDFFFKYNH